MAISAPRPTYRSLEDTLLLLETWQAARPNTTRLVDLGQSAGGRPIRALEIFGPGCTPPEERSTFLMIGGLDGVSLHGAEEVLGIAAGLASEAPMLSGDLTFVCLPWASPDGLAAELQSIQGVGISTLGRDATPIDDDLDGISGEDGADDVDGDGRVTMMLVEEDDGAWRRAPDGRFLLPYDHELGSGPRYGLYREGRDDDGDGAYNEDGPGGVRADRNFSAGWIGPFASVSPGTLPMNSAPAEGLAGLVRERRIAGAWFLDGHSGRPEVTRFGIDGESQPSLIELSIQLHRATLDAVPETYAAIAGAPIGSGMDWLRARGAAAMRLSFWGPEIGLGRTAVRPANLRSDEFVAPPELLEDFCSPDNGAARGGAWRRYLDERRGGIGFIDWHPVELKDKRRALVGGWEASVLHNPPEEQLERSVIMAMNFVGALMRAIPEPALEIESVTRVDELCRISARVGRANPNEGPELSIDFLAPEGLQLELRLPPGARLIAGPESHTVNDANLDQVVEWVIYAPVDSMIEVQLERGGVPMRSREVRP